MGTSLIQIGQALSGASLPIAYGPVRVRGNELINQQLSDNSRIVLHILGEGSWDGIDRLWINKKLVNIGDVTLVHFHPGTDGTLGGGLAPTSNGGDQLVDNFWSSLPVNMQRLTYSRKAYLMLKVPPDPQSPDASLDVIGDYRALKVRIFDNVGNQTAFQYSQNYVWMILDLLVRLMLNREWLVSSAAAAGGDLSAAQKARIDFQSFSDSAAWCDFNIGGGIKRFEGGVAYPQMVGLKQALDQLCTLSQTYLVERSGKILLYSDQARVSTFTMTRDHVTAGTFDPTKSQLRSASNRFIATFNDLNAQKSADIDTVGNTGLSRTANVVTVKVPAGQQHPFLVGDNVDIVNPTDASFAGTITVASVIDNRNFTGAQAGANATSGGGYVGTTESRFAQRTKIVDHEQHQLAVGQRGLNLTPTYKRVPVSIDLGNNTMERTERILNFVKVRNLGADATPYAAPFTVNVQASLYAVDVNGKTLIEQICGDIITIDKSVSEEFQGDYEIMKMQISLAGGSASVGGNSSGQSAQASTIDLTLKQYLPGAFSDSADTPQTIFPPISRIGLKAVETLDGSGNQVISLGKTIDDPVTLRNAVRDIDANRRGIIDFTQGHLSKNVDNLADGSTYGRPLLLRLSSGKPWIDFSEGIHSGKNLSNIPDDAGSSRYAVLVIDGSRRAIVDFTQGHLNKNLDNLADTATYFRRRSGILLPSEMPYNGSFELFSDSAVIAEGWEKDFETSGAAASPGFSRSTASPSPFSGNYCQVVDNTSNSAGNGGTSQASRPIAVRPNTKYEFTVRAQSTVANPGAMYFRIVWYTDDGDFTRSGHVSAVRALDDVVASGGPTAANAWQQFSATFTSPSDAKYCRVALYNWSAGTHSRMAFDAVLMRPADVAQVDGGVDSSGNILLKNLVQGVASTAGPTTTSGTPSVIPEMTQTITTKGNKVLVVFNGTFQVSVLAGLLSIYIYKDGASIGYVSLASAPGASYYFPCPISWIDSPSAASHTYDIRWTISSGTATAVGTDRALHILELG